MPITPRPRFQAVRVEEDLTIEEFQKILSKESGQEVTLQSLTAWENAVRYPPLNIIVVYCKIFNISYSYLLNLTKIDGKLETFDVNFRFPGNCTYAELKKKTGISFNTLKAYTSTNSTYRVTFNKLNNLANTFGCSVDYFLGLTTYRTWEEYAIEHRMFKNITKECIICFTPKILNFESNKYEEFFGSERYGILSEDRESFIFSDGTSIPVTDGVIYHYYNLRLVYDENLQN